jgi:hypothetical protein
VQEWGDLLGVRVKNIEYQLNILICIYYQVDTPADYSDRPIELFDGIVEHEGTYIQISGSDGPWTEDRGQRTEEQVTRRP